ncbi:hypothetical protein F4777DRAFT_953 [Nemania sp. FL0916]|nr:hypothetical protein F4777DRAFT_953 [Nemania sp. FL0916]
MEAAVASKATWWSYHESGWNRSKLILRCCSFLLSIIVLGISAREGVRVDYWQNYDVYLYRDWLFTVPLTLFSIALDGVELVLGTLWKRNPGVHPGWHVGGELAILGGNITALIFLGSTVPTNYDLFGQPFDPYPTEARNLMIGIIVFLGLFTADRFVLFVIACVDTHWHHTAAQVEFIVKTLRQQTANDPATAAIIHSLHPSNHIGYRQPLQDLHLPQMAQPAYKPNSGDNSEFYLELPENQKFLANIRDNLNGAPHV